MARTINKILIIEDEELILRAFSEGLKRRRFQTIEAADGKKGLELIMTEKPDLVFLDLILPVLSGQDILLKMKELGVLDQIPVIVLTNVSDNDTFNKCMKLGAKEYVIKSNFSFDELENTIRKVAERLD